MLFAVSAVAMWCLWVATPASAQQGSPAGGVEEAEAAFVARLDAERAGAGLPGLRPNAALRAVARDWSAVMAREAQLRHNPRLADQAPGAWQAVGENVGVSTKSHATLAEQVERLHAAFMASPEHRANALGDWNEVAVGVVVGPPETMWVTVNFLRGPVEAPSPPAPPAPPPAHVREAIVVSREVFAAQGSARHVVLVRAESFADALGGAALAGGDGPVLFTAGASRDHPDRPLGADVRAEVDRVLADGGRVYLLGGVAALSAAVERELQQAGHTVTRLSGPTRVDTAVQVAEEVSRLRGRPQEVIIAGDGNWPDAVAAGAYAAHAGVPVLLTRRDELPAAVRTFLGQTGPAPRWVVGGRAAVSDQVVAEAGAVRVSGPDRSATAVAVARALWHRDEAGPGDGLIVVPGYRDDGWAYALAYAALSARTGQPQLLVGQDISAAVREYLLLAGYDSASPTPLRFSSTVPSAVAEQLRALVGP